MRADARHLGDRCLVLLLSLVGVAAAAGDLRLVEAAKRQDLTATDALIAEHVDVNTPQADGATALHWAIHWTDLQMADLLIRAGAHVNAANDFGVTPLSLACTNANAVMVEKLLAAGADPNLALLTGETPLMTAARTGDAAVVDALLARGADVHAKEAAQEQTALMWAVSEKHAGVVRTLIEHGADVQARSKGGFTPLLFAAREGDLEAARLLVAAGANVNETALDAISALVVATVRGHVALATFLLEQGADPQAAGAGFTALHWAAGSWETELTGPRGILPDADDEWFALGGVRTGKLELVKTLLAHGANPNALLVKPPPRVGFSVLRVSLLTGATPFFLAARAGDAGVMRVLAAHGADPLMATKDGTTPLMAAAGVGRIMQESRVTEARAFEAVTLAVELGADINAVNQAGEAALHGAAHIRSDTIVQFLVDNGAVLNLKNKRGETPLMVAERTIAPGTAPVAVRTSTGDLLRKLGAEAAADDRVRR